MKDKERVMETYEAPKVEVVEVMIENGFAVSVYATGNSWEQGGGGSLGTE